MNLKELQELRRQLKWENDKLNVVSLQEAYGLNCEDGPVVRCAMDLDWSDIGEEKAGLYLSLLKKSLSGVLGKNLMELAFETSVNEPASMQKKLYSLRSSSQPDTSAFSKMAEEIIAKGDYRLPVHILCAILEYAAPDMNKNREVQEGSSMFRFVILTVTPGKMSDVGLFFNEDENEIQRRETQEMLIPQNPKDSFLYPCFTDRQADVNHILYRCDPKSPNIPLVEEFMQISFAASAADQKEGFTAMLQDVFAEGIPVQVAVGLHNSITETMTEDAQEDGAVMLSKEDIKSMLSRVGTDSETLSRYDAAYENCLENQDIAAVNLMEKGKMTIKAPSLTLSVKDDGLSRLKTRKIDGISYLLIPMDGSMEISGLPMMAEAEDPSEQED